MSADLIAASREAAQLRARLDQQARETAKWRWAYDIERRRRESTERLVDELIAGETSALPPEEAA